MTLVFVINTGWQCVQLFVRNSIGQSCSQVLIVQVQVQVPGVSVSLSTQHTSKRSLWVRHGWTRVQRQHLLLEQVTQSSQADTVYWVTFVYSPKFETVFTGPLLTTQVQVHCHLCFCSCRCCLLNVCSGVVAGKQLRSFCWWSRSRLSIHRWGWRRWTGSQPIIYTWYFLDFSCYHVWKII